MSLFLTTATKADPATGNPWPARFAFLCAAIVLGVFVRWLIWKKDQELIQLRQQVALAQLDVRKAETDRAVSGASDAYHDAKADLFILEQTLTVEESRLNEKKAAVDALAARDWAALNKLAGVKP